jgi:hypothetical protein
VGMDIRISVFMDIRISLSMDIRISLSMSRFFFLLLLHVLKSERQKIFRLISISSMKHTSNINTSGFFKAEDGVVARLQTGRQRKRVYIPGTSKGFFSNSKHSNRLWGPPSPLHNEHRDFSPVVQRPQCEPNHPISSTTEVRNDWSRIPTPPHASTVPTETT